MNNSIRVALADDHVFVRAGIKSLLETEENIIVVGEATDGLEALKVVEESKPDLLIVDIRMPHLTGIEVVEKLRTKENPIKVIMLSMHESEEYVLKSIKAGADGNRQAWLEDPDGNRIELMEMADDCLQYQAIKRLHAANS